MGWLYTWGILFVISPGWAVALFIPMVLVALTIDVTKDVIRG